MVILIYNQTVKWVAFPHLCQPLTLSDSYNICPSDGWCINLLSNEITRGILDISIVFFWVFTFLPLNQTKTSVLLLNAVCLALICHDCTNHLRKEWCDTSHLQLNIICWLIKCLEGLGLLSDNFYKKKNNFCLNCHQPSWPILWNATSSNPVIASLGISPTKALVWLPNIACWRQERAAYRSPGVLPVGRSGAGESQRPPEALRPACGPAQTQRRDGCRGGAAARGGPARLPS